LWGVDIGEVSVGLVTRDIGVVSVSVSVSRICGPRWSDVVDKFFDYQKRCIEVKVCKVNAKSLIKRTENL